MRVIRDWARSWQRVTDGLLQFAFDLLDDPPEPLALGDMDLGGPGSPVRELVDSLPWPPFSAWLTPWSLYWWRPVRTHPVRRPAGWREPTLAEEWLRRGARLPPRELAYVKGAVGSAFSLLEVEARAPATVFLRDLLLGRRHVLVDPALADGVREGWILYAAVARMPFGDALLGAGPMILRHRGELPVDSLREELHLPAGARGVRVLRREWRRVAGTYLRYLAGDPETDALTR